jgi:mannose-6-phosphate isomerase-like protein (cupin superfamily)
LEKFLQMELRHTGEIIRLRRIRNSAGEIILSIDGSSPPHSGGPPPHIHLQNAEAVTVKAGTLGASVGNNKIQVSTGGSAVFPAGVVHTWWNAGEDLLELSGHVTPAVDLDRFLQALWAVLNASPSGRPSLFYLAHVLWRHRHSQIITRPPRFVQRILFPVILFVGRALGKYRGDAWPGSPASCPGAPEAEVAAD